MKRGTVKPRAPSPSARLDRAAYFSELLIDANVPLSLVPRPFTVAMMAMEMPAAIRPYSIAVAPDSSDKKSRNRFKVASYESLPVRASAPVPLQEAA